MRKILLTLLLLFPVISLAGPWCLVIDGNERCSYKSAEACYQASSSRGGSCRENYRSLGAKGNYPWCLVTSQSRRCVYGVKEACLRAARNVNGGCVDNTELALKKSQSSKRAKSALLGCEEGDVACEISAQVVQSQLAEGQELGGAAVEESYDEGSLDNY